MATCKVLFAGFGGQGILFAGRVLAQNGLLEDKYVSWLPSYGPEMRGGTANCHVTISDEPVGTPIMDPDILVAMNAPSFDKFENDVVSGGLMIVDSALVSRTSCRDDVRIFYIPATRMASDNGIKTLANMIMLGKLIRETSLIDYGKVPGLMEQLVPAGKTDLLELNLKAIKLGYEYEN